MRPIKSKPPSCSHSTEGILTVHHRRVSNQSEENLERGHVSWLKATTIPITISAGAHVHHEGTASDTIVS